MNVNAIWSGEEYAFFEYKGNKAFVMNARRGKCIKTEKVEPAWGGQRAKTFVVFNELHPETGEPMGEARIRARDVIDEWTAYVNERNGYKREREEKYALEEQERQRRLAEREERYRLENEAREARERQERERTERVVAALVNRTAIPKEIIHSVSGQLVCLDRTGLEFWLSLPDPDRTT